VADKKFKVEGPDGRVIMVTAPEDATDAQIEAIASAEFYKKPAPERPKAVMDEEGRMRILRAEQERAVRVLKRANDSGDMQAIRRAQGDLDAVLREIRNSPISGGTTEPPKPPPVSPAQTLATKAREMTQSVDPTRAIIDLAAAAGGAGGAQVMQSLGAAPGVQMPQPTRGVAGWTEQMGYGQRGGQTYKQAHEFEQGLRKGAKIGGIQPEFRFAKPPVMEPSGLQRASQFMSSMPKTVGALGGLGMAESGMEAMRRMDQGDPVGASIAGMGAIGGGAAMIPGGQLLGTAMSVGSPLTLYLLDKMRSRGISGPEAQRMLTNVDPMGNPMP